MDNIYLFSGNDQFSIDEHIKKIIDDHKGSTVIKYKGRNFSLDKSIDEIRFKDLFDPCKIIIMEHDVFHGDKKEQDLFVTVLKDSPKENISIFICPKVLKSSSINRRIFSKTENVFEYSQPKNSNKKDVVNYVYNILKLKDIKITKNMVELTVELMGLNASDILFEIIRLYKRHEVVNEKILKEFIPKTHFSMFDMTNVLAQRDIKRTLTMYDAFIDAGFNFHEIFMSIYLQIRLLFLIKMMVKNYGIKDYRQIAGQIRHHPYQVKKNLQYINNYSYSELQNSFKVMLDYQRKMYNNSNNSTMILKVMITNILSK